MGVLFCGTTTRDSSPMCTCRPLFYRRSVTACLVCLGLALSPVGAKTPPASVVGHILTAASSIGSLGIAMYAIPNAVTATCTGYRQSCRTRRLRSPNGDRHHGFAAQAPRARPCPAWCRQEIIRLAPRCPIVFQRRMPALTLTDGQAGTSIFARCGGSTGRLCRSADAALLSSGAMSAWPPKSDSEASRPRRPLLQRPSQRVDPHLYWQPKF